MAVETSAGNTEVDINFEVKGGGNVCLTCGARARSVVTMEAYCTQHGRRQKRIESALVGGRRGLDSRSGSPRTRIGRRRRGLRPVVALRQSRQMMLEEGPGRTRVR